MYCLDGARAGARESASAPPDAVLRGLAELAARGDVAARRLVFGILGDRDRTICYRCKRSAPVQRSPSRRETLAALATARPGPARTEASAVGGKVAEGAPRPPSVADASQQERRAA